MDKKTGHFWSMFGFFVKPPCHPIVGFYLATVYAGALSTTSSFLNAMSMLALTDILQHFQK